MIASQRSLHPPAECSAASGAGTSNALIAVLALAGGVTLAPIYYAQPLLDLVGETFHVGSAAVAAVPAATQAGYALGMLMLVPLGDYAPRRPLILVLVAVLGAGCAIAAVAPTLALLALASAVIGATATVTQQIVPLAARMAGDADRGRILGFVVAGLLSGIAVAWGVSGVVGGWFGWRAVFAVAAATTVLIAAVLAWRLPAEGAAPRLSLVNTYASMIGFWRAHALLRQSSLVQTLVFAAYASFWANVVHLLRLPALGLSTLQVGLFGLIGPSAPLGTIAAGRLADRGRSAIAITIGATLTAAALALSAWAGPSLLPQLTAGCLVSLGMPLALVANQSRIYALDREAQSRINTVFVAWQFAGGAAAAWIGGVAFQRFGWPAVAGPGALCAAMALIAHGVKERAASR